MRLPNWRWLPWYEPPKPKRRYAHRILDVVAYLGAGWLVARPWLRRLGANQAELRRTYPGDDLFGHAEVITRAITIEARAADIWPWIAQMGWGRGGWYSIDLIDNLGRSSARAVMPEFQQLAVGDRVPTGPRGGFVVHDVEPERFLVLTAEGRFGMMSWLLWLEPIDDNSTRLVERIRGNASASPLAQFAALFGDAGDVVMMLAHLQNLKRRAERSAAERIARAVATGAVFSEPAAPSEGARPAGEVTRPADAGPSASA